MFDGLEFKPHLGGHWDKAHYSRGVLHGASAQTSNRMLPHCGVEGLSTLGMKQQRVYLAISHRPIRTKQRPNEQQNAAPLRLRRVVDTGPEAEENRISTTPRARAARHREVPVLCLERHWLRMQHPSMKPNPSGIQRGVALLLHWPSHSTLENVCLPPCGLGTTVGWVGCQIFLLKCRYFGMCSKNIFGKGNG